MVSVLLRTAAGTALFVAFLWLVRIDDYRVAGMMLTFPMLNGMALVSAARECAQDGAVDGADRRHSTASCAFCSRWRWPGRTRHARIPLALTVLAAVLWLCVYAVLETRNVVVPWGAATVVFAAACIVASVAITIWLWPACAPLAAEAPVRAGGLAGVLESWIRIALFALSLSDRVRRRALLPGCACCHRAARRLADRAAVRALHGGERARLRPCRGPQARDHAVHGADRLDDRPGVRGRCWRPTWRARPPLGRARSGTSPR